MQNIERYEAEIQAARDRLSSTLAVQKFLSPGVDPGMLEAFLISFCALGVGMTELVEDWIRRAGERCVEIGITDLVKHCRDTRRPRPITTCS
jgi:hypothetical protein